jgi:hypothetical protein
MMQRFKKPFEQMNKEQGMLNKDRKINSPHSRSTFLVRLFLAHLFPSCSKETLLKQGACNIQHEKK